MFDVVSDVRKERAPRLDAFDVLERFVDPQMCRVFPETQTVEHEHVQAAQRIDRLLRDLAEIGEIRKIVEAIGHHRQTSVDHFNRRDLQILADAKTGAWCNDICNHHGQTAAEVRRLEDVLEHAPDVDPGTLICVNAERSEAKVQRPDVVETKDVIGVTVCDQDRVEMFESKAKRLLSKVHRSVDEDSAARVFDDY